MSVIALPSWLKAQTLSPPALRRSTLTSVGRYSGAVDLAGTFTERWAMSIGLAPTTQADAARLEVLINQLAGGVDQLACHHLARPRPQGTMRGSPTLSATTAQGGVSLQITGATSGVNLIDGGSFEVDSNADGLADKWTRYSGGTFSGLTQARSGGVLAHGSWSQNLNASTLGNTSGDRQGITRSDVPLAQAAGRNVTISATVLGTPVNSKITFILSIFNGVGTNVANIIGADINVTTGFQSAVVTGAVPAGSVTGQLFVYQHSNPGGSCGFYVDALQIEVGSTATPFAAYPTLQAGDMLSPGQLVQVATDVQFDDLGRATVPIVNRARTALASGTPVLWDRPTTNWRLVSDAAMVMRPGLAEGVQLDLVEWP